MVCLAFAIDFPAFFIKNIIFVRTKCGLSVEIKKRKPGRPGVYSSSSERAKAWRERQKKLSANAEIGAVSDILSEQMGRECFLPHSIRLINQASVAANIAKIIIQLLESGSRPIPETERAFLENVVQFFDGVDAVAKNTTLSVSLRAKRLDNARVVEMTNAVARLVMRADLDCINLV